MRDDSNAVRSMLDRRSVLVTGTTALAGLGTLSTAHAASAQNDSASDTPVETPDDGDETELPDDSDYEQEETITDDTETIECTVPADWNDVDGTTIDIGPALRAAPDLEDYTTTWDVPGIELIVMTELDDDQEYVPEALVDFSSECADGGQQSFQSGGFVFQAQTWYQCGGGDTLYLAMVGAPGESANGSENAAFPSDPPYLIFFGAQLVTEPDLDAVGTVIESLEITSPEEVTV